MKDYYVLFTSDCCATYSQAQHDATLFNISQFFGQVVTSDEIIACWPQRRPNCGRCLNVLSATLQRRRLPLPLGGEGSHRRRGCYRESSPSAQPLRKPIRHAGPHHRVDVVATMIAVRRDIERDIRALRHRLPQPLDLLGRDQLVLRPCSARRTAHPLGLA